MAAPASSIMDLISQIAPASVSSSLSVPLSLGHVGGLPQAVPTSTGHASGVAGLPSLSAILRSVVKAEPAASQSLAPLGEVGQLADRSQLPLVSQPLDLSGTTSAMDPRPEDEIAISVPRKRHGKRFKQDEEAFDKATSAPSADALPFQVRHGLAPQTWTKRHERSRKNIRVPWSKEETDALERGVLVHSTRWSRILNDPALHEALTANARSSVDLKDKWRNWSNKLRQRRNPLGWVGSKAAIPQDMLAQAMQEGIPLPGTPAEAQAREAGNSLTNKGEGGRPAATRVTISAAAHEAEQAASATAVPAATATMLAVNHALPSILPITDTGMASWDATIALSSADPAGIASAIARLHPVTFSQTASATMALPFVHVAPPQAATAQTNTVPAATAKRPREASVAASSSSSSSTTAATTSGTTEEDQARDGAEAADEAHSTGKFAIAIVDKSGSPLLRLSATGATGLSAISRQAADTLGHDASKFFLIHDSPVHAYSVVSTASVASILGDHPCTGTLIAVSSKAGLIALLRKMNAM